MRSKHARTSGELTFRSLLTETPDAIPVRAAISLTELAPHWVRREGIVDGELVAVEAITRVELLSCPDWKRPVSPVALRPAAILRQSLQ